MFTPDDRERLREELVAAARRDPRIVAAAATGSAATGKLDRWSDIDLAFRVADGADIGQVIADWTGQMYRDHGAVHHVDVTRGNVLFRVFLLASTLQVDLAFWPSARPSGSCSARPRRGRRGRHPRSANWSGWVGCTRCTPGRASSGGSCGRRSTW